MNKKSRLLTLVLTTIVSFLVSFGAIQAANSQNTKKGVSENTVEITTFADGKTKDEAKKYALRDAIEKAFGTFVSAKTEVLNDELVRDEIVTISRGNIQSYEEISSSLLPNGNTSITIKAVVSIDKLVAYAKSKGMSTELSGQTFVMNRKILELNIKSKETALDHLYDEFFAWISNAQLVNYTISTKDPESMGNGKFAVPIKVTLYSKEVALVSEDDKNKNNYIKIASDIHLDDEIAQFFRFEYSRLFNKKNKNKKFFIGVVNGEGLVHSDWYPYGGRNSMSYYAFLKWEFERRLKPIVLTRREEQDCKTYDVSVLELKYKERIVRAAFDHFLDYTLLQFKVCDNIGTTSKITLRSAEFYGCDASRFRIYDDKCPCYRKEYGGVYGPDGVFWYGGTGVHTFCPSLFLFSWTSNGKFDLSRDAKLFGFHSGYFNGSAIGCQAFGRKNTAISYHDDDKFRYEVDCGRGSYWKDYKKDLVSKYYHSKNQFPSGGRLPARGHFFARAVATDADLNDKPDTCIAFARLGIRIIYDEKELEQLGKISIEPINVPFESQMLKKVFYTRKGVVWRRDADIHDLFGVVDAYIKILNK